nr:unnamed protein product [Digitaria exilis]
MEGNGGGGGGGGGDAEGARGSFQWDADSQLYYHASTGFYHDPVAGWYYNSRDGQYYIYENGNYMPLTTDLGNKPASNDEAILESSCLEPAIPDDENEILTPPSEWMEETLINLYLSGYSNREGNAESSLGDTHTNEEEKWLAQYGQIMIAKVSLWLGLWDAYLGVPVSFILLCLLVVDV